MRTAFIETLTEEAAKNPDVCLVVGDLGFGVVTDFAESMPKQFLNPGVAEQNMTGVAAGMAMMGKNVFTYSIANFPTIRPLEQIRNDICYHNANVKVVSVGGGFCYGALGPTHFATEDLAIMRSLPNMLVIAPGDPVEAKLATRALVEHEGPAYLRLGRAGEPSVHKAEFNYKLGKSVTIKDGADVTLLALGGMLFNTKKAADLLESHGVNARVLSMGSLKPLDTEAVYKAANETAAVVTVEEHSLIGGLGSAVSEYLMEAGARVKFRRLGVPSEFPTKVGSQDWFIEQYSLTPSGIAESILDLLK